MGVVANVAVNVDARNAKQSLRDISGQADKTQRSFERLTGSVTRLASAFAGIQAFKFVFGKTAELEKQSRSLEVLTGSAEKAGQIIKELQQLGAVTPFTSTELIDSAKRLQAFGVETEKVVETTRRLADVSGATGAELQGLVTAYGQVQAKGRLQGEELLQFQERGVALQKVLKEEYRLSGEEFQKALSKGQISAEAVEYAIKKLTDAGGKYADGAIAQSDTLSGRLSTLQDGIEQLARTIGTKLSPAIKSVLNLAIEAADVINTLLGDKIQRNIAIGATSQAVDDITNAINRIGTGAGAAGIERNLQLLAKYQQLLQQIRPTDPNADRAVKLQGVIFQKINQNLEAQKKLNKELSTGEEAALPALLTPTETGKDKKDDTADRLKASKDLLDVLEAQLKVAQEQNPVEKILLEGDLERLQINQEYRDLQVGVTDEMTKQNLERARALEIEKQIVGENEKLKNLGQSLGSDMAQMLMSNKKLTEEEEKQKQLYEGIYDTVANQLQSGIQGLIDGSKTLNDVLSDILGALGDLFLSLAFDIGKGALGKSLGIPGFAQGGYVDRPTPALVGEGGSDEYIIPASKMDSAMSRWNAGARGDAVISGADPTSDGYGGAMFADAPSQINISGGVFQYNDTNYIRQDQIPGIVSQASKQGEARALRRLQMSPSTRRKVGI